MSLELFPPVRLPWWKKLFRKPLFWALICAVLALPWYLNGNGMELLPFLLTLVGGWLCGFAFVNFTLGIQRTWWGVLLHAVVAVVAALLLHWVVFNGSSFLKTLPEQLRAVLFCVQMGAIPGVGWIWLGLLSRITSVVAKPAKTAKVTRLAPGWEDTSPGTRVQFWALPMSMRTLTWAIVGMCVLGGGLAFLLMIAFDSFLLRFGSAKLFIIVFGVLIALPGYYLFRTILGRKTTRHTVSFAKDRMTIETESNITTIPYVDLERLIWRNASDYARMEVRGGAHTLSLLVGMARTPKTVLPQLPPLSQQTIQRLINAGMEKQPSRRPGVTILVVDPSARHSDRAKIRERS
ncbi:hypothetical protein CVS30_04605 [Arthrobacter psychrolactophilus]|uniref:Uncharacterized protein n=1 Tax=Arthrobacter psychrolactophilus TaxID=92442 RepID=A0A2V5IY29_9MICC|nr:hypothetical protein [Arthrobacter psychrolactophilus]PYI39253.1 hypothetical protein CVS30_04605 [Arthrobacter psychrolactophilus]